MLLISYSLRERCFNQCFLKNCTIIYNIATQLITAKDRNVNEQFLKIKRQWKEANYYLKFRFAYIEDMMQSVDWHRLVVQYHQ